MTPADQMTTNARAANRFHGRRRYADAQARFNQNRCNIAWTL